VSSSSQDSSISIYLQNTSYLRCYADRSRAQEYTRQERQLWVLLPVPEPGSGEESDGSEDVADPPPPPPSPSSHHAPPTPPPPPPHPVPAPPCTPALYDEAALLGYRARQHFNASAREARCGRDLLTQALAWPPDVAAHAFRLAGQQGGAPGVSSAPEPAVQELMQEAASTTTPGGSGKRGLAPPVGGDTAEQGKRRSVLAVGSDDLSSLGELDHNGVGLVDDFLLRDEW